MTGVTGADIVHERTTDAELAGSGVAFSKVEKAGAPSKQRAVSAAPRLPGSRWLERGADAQLEVA